MTSLPLETSTAARTTYRSLKRALDILAGLVGCLLLALSLPVIYLANLWGNPGPLFYRQERVGQFGRPFKMLKFRSMHRQAEENGIVTWATVEDPRATRFGRLLRRSHLDELPQFWHILIGEMSLVGPRPERPYFVRQLIALEPNYALRHQVKPGLTGHAQVTQGYVASFEDSLAKLALDLHYIQHRSLRFDLLILLKTIPSLWRLNG